jgi:magnesium transporter
MSLEAIQELLRKQKLYEGLIHGQSAARQSVVETLVHRQHLAEISNLMARLPSEEIGRILEALPLEDAQLLWTRIPEERENELLWELSDGVREALAGSREPGFSESQMNAFDLRDGRLHQVAIIGRKNLVGIRPVWIDLVAATKPERRYVGEHFGVDLPDPGNATDLEESSRFQIDDNGDIRLNSNFLLDRADESRSVPVSFVIHDGTVFSLRNEELPVFRLQRRRAHTQVGQVSDCFDLLVDLYGTGIEYSADALEGIYKRLGNIGKQVLSEKMSDEDAASVLAAIAEEEDLNGRVRGNILDTQRALSFLMRARVMSAQQLEDARQVMRDIDSLNGHTAFLFDKINFLMDATIGFININQNKRISQLTVFSVVIMPLNIVAGVGGMSEFSMMTEGVPWPLSYSGLILAMALIGWATYLGLKRAELRRLGKRAAKPGSEA